MLQDDYIIDFSERGDRSLCHMLIFPNTANYFLMGLPFFQGYYAHHDMDLMQIGFIPHNLSAKSYIKEATTLPQTVISNPTVSLTARYIVMFMVFAVGIVYYCSVDPVLKGMFPDEN